MKVELLQSGGYNTNLLAMLIKDFREMYPDQTQFMITSKLGDNNFTEGAGTESTPEDYNTINTYFQESIVSDLINDFPDYVRWRILCMPPKRTYSIHNDGWRKGHLNKRIHIPVVTNPDAFLVFYESKLRGNGAQRIEHHNLKIGEIYEVDTTGFHTAVNYHTTEERIHIVAERFVPNE